MVRPFLCAAWGKDKIHGKEQGRPFGRPCVFRDHFFFVGLNAIRRMSSPITGKAMASTIKK